MIPIQFILKDGTARSVEGRAGDSVMETAIRQNIRGIDAECGGACACATCHVYVADDWIARLAPPDEMELDMLDSVAADREAGSRLSCQIPLTAALAGLVVRVPPTQS
jgi:2Fe-2S ferredoxin